MKKELERRLNRLKERKERLENVHLGNETKFTYWGGHEMGYLKGKITELENILDLIEEL